MENVLIVLSGFAAGVISGSMGVGGGVLMVPLLVFLFGFGERLAQGTSLAAIVPISMVGAFTHFRQGNVLVRPALWMGLVGAPLAALGALLAQHVPGPQLSRIFGLLMLYSAYRLWPLWKPSFSLRGPGAGSETS